MKGAALCLLAAAAGVCAQEPAAPSQETMTVQEKRDYCSKWMTPEKMIVHQYGPYSRQGLFDYATCEELFTKDDTLCGYFPGGTAPRGGDLGEGAKETFTYVKADGKIHQTYEYGVCTSKAAGYLFLQLLVQEKPAADLVPYARRMLYGERKISPEDYSEVAQTIYRSQRLEWPKHPELARRGFLNYLLGSKACGQVRLGRLRRECRHKAAALAAVKAGDATLCGKDDLMCQALLSGEKTCLKPGRMAVETFCRDVFPELKLKEDEWRLIPVSLEALEASPAKK